MNSLFLFIMYGQKSIKILCEDNIERVKSYDFRVKTLRKLKDFRVNEDLLDELDKSKRNSSNHDAIVNGLQSYLGEIEKKLNKVIETASLSDFTVEVIVLVDEQVKLLREHYEKVKMCLAKEKVIPEHHLDSHIVNYYHAFKKEVASSQSIVNNSVVRDLEIVFDEIKSNLDSYKSLLEQAQDFSESDCLKLKSVYERYLAKGAPYNSLKVLYKEIVYIQKVIVLLKNLISAEAKVVYKWTHN